MAFGLACTYSMAAAVAAVGGPRRQFIEEPVAAANAQA